MRSVSADRVLGAWITWQADAEITSFEELATMVLG